jgi:uncharacterized protein
MSVNMSDISLKVNFQTICLRYSSLSSFPSVKIRRGEASSFHPDTIDATFYPGKTTHMIQCIAFEGTRQIASGDLTHVAQKTKKLIDRGERAPILILDSITSRPIEIDFRGTTANVLSRLTAPPKSIEPSPTEPKRIGRPKLGVVPREVTLLPRHWEWLNCQPGGASVALRRLVEEARKVNAPQDKKREAQESAYRFMTALAGNLPGYEEALRAMYAGNRQAFNQSTRKWPKHIRDHTRTLARRAIIRRTA